jgi:hypothetical protein
MVELSPDYLYLIISESDYGIAGCANTPGSVPSNILILSASGMGHIAVPWLQCNFPPPAKLYHNATHFVSFCGNPRSSRERKLLLEIARSALGRDLFEYRGNDWANVSMNSQFSLAPAGIAVGTYRTTELIRLGVIPIIATEAVHWLPYYPALNWSRFAILTNPAEFPRAVARIRAMSEEERKEMQREVIEVGVKFFQWDGFFTHFEMFLRGGRSYFTCSKESLTPFYS